MRIGELCEKTGISRDALRFYEKRGLIKAFRRPNGYRHYSEQTIFLLDFIVTAKSLGFTLTEIKEELPTLLVQGLSADEIARILTQKLSLLDARIEALNALRESIAARINKSCPLAAPANVKHPD